LNNQEVFHSKWNSLIKEGKANGFFPKPPIENLFISPCGLVPKADGGFRMIRDLSLGDYSVNQQTSKGLVVFEDQDKIVDTLLLKGKNAFLVKFDVVEHLNLFQQEYIT